MNITLKILEDNQDALKAKFGANEGIAYANVSMTQLSIARHYGGCTVQGKHFIYNPTDDSLIRGDVITWLSKKIRSNAEADVIAAEDVMLIGDDNEDKKGEL